MFGYGFFIIKIPVERKRGNKKLKINEIFKIKTKSNNLFYDTSRMKGLNFFN